MIKINYQKNYNDCGICVLQSLINHYHHHKISYDELLSQLNVTSDGISIFDLERIGLKYGLILESYQCEFNELESYRNNEYFILLIKNNEMLHYVIAKKNKKKVTIYCSESGEYEINIDELKEKWTGILIQCSKTKFSLKDFSTNSFWSNINWSYVIANNLFNVLVVILSIIGASFFEQYLNNVINNYQLTNLLSIIIIFLLINICKFIGDKFLQLFSFHRTYKHYIFLNKTILQQLQLKYLNFYQKIDLNNIRNIDEHIYNISNFYNTTFNRFISDVIFFAITLIILFVINVYIGLIVLALVTIDIFIDLIIYHYNKNKHNNFVNIRNEYMNNLIGFIDQLKYTYNSEYQNRNIMLIEKNQFKLKNILYDSFKINDFLIITNHIIFQIVYMIIFIIASYYIVEAKTLTIPKFCFILSLVQLIINSIKSILNIFKQYQPFNYSLDVLKTILNIDNIDLNNNGVYNIKALDQISYKDYSFTSDTLIQGRSGVGKTTLLLNICNMNNNIQDIIYNNVTKSNLSNKYFKDNFIYISNNSPIFTEDIISLMENTNYQEVICNVIKMLEIKNFNNLSCGQKQALIFISLLKYINKVILIDELLSNVDYIIKQELLKTIKPLIVKKNFILFVSHDEKIGDYFKQVVCYE